MNKVVVDEAKIKDFTRFLLIKKWCWYFIPVMSYNKPICELFRMTDELKKGVESTLLDVYTRNKNKQGMII